MPALVGSVLDDVSSSGPTTGKRLTGLDKVECVGLIVCLDNVPDFRDD